MSRVIEFRDAVGDITFARAVSPTSYEWRCPDCSPHWDTAHLCEVDDPSDIHHVATDEIKELCAERAMVFDGGRMNDKEKANAIEFGKREPPRGWIQWKGTGVCVDIHCACGEMSHFDGEFMYYIQCCHCGRKYSCDGNIRLHEIRDGSVDDECCLQVTE